MGQVPLQEGQSSACRRRKETLQVQAWYSCPLRDLQVSKINGVADQKAPIPEVGEGDCPGLQVKDELCQWGNPGTAGGSGGLSGWPIQRHQPVCHPHQVHYHHAKGHRVGQMHPWGVLITLALFRAKQTKQVPVGPPTPPRGNNLKSY